MASKEDNLAQLEAQGVAVWLEDISRERLRTGNLQQLIDDDHVLGVTSNPTIFASALAKGDAYDGQTHDLGIRGVSIDEADKLLKGLPLGQANLLTFDLLPIGPLLPLGMLMAAK